VCSSDLGEKKKDSVKGRREGGRVARPPVGQVVSLVRDLQPANHDTRFDEGLRKGGGETRSSSVPVATEDNVSGAQTLR
jgi:hypothetical protein